MKNTTKAISLESVADSPKTAQEIMDGELTIKSKFSRDPDKSRKKGIKCTAPLLRNHLVAQNVVKHSPQKINWTAMKESTPMRDHSAAQSVTTNAQR